MADTGINKVVPDDTWSTMVDTILSSIKNGNKHSIGKAELEIIGNMYRKKRYDECIKEVRSKLKQNPNSLHLLNYQAMAYSALKRDKEALLSYQKITKADPTLAGPYYNMGIILKRNGKAARGCKRRRTRQTRREEERKEGGR